MATLGDTNIEAGQDARAPRNLLAFVYTMPENGTLTSISGYMDGLQAGHSNDEGFYLDVYNDVAGTPGSLFASGTGTVANGSAGQWYTVAASGSLISGNSYWIGIYVANDSGNCIRTYWHNSGATMKNKLDAGATNPDPFPTPDGTATEQHSFYLTYTPSGAPNTLIPTWARVRYS